MNTKVLKNTRHVLKFTYDSAVIRQRWTYLLSVQHHYTTNKSCKESKFSTESFSLVKMMGKRGTIYRGTGSSDAVSTLCDKKVDHGTFLETVLLLAKYNNILKCHLENVYKTNPISTSITCKQIYIYLRNYC